MDSRLSKARDSPRKERRKNLLAKYKFLCEKELLHLVRRRDLIRLLLSYPVKLEEEGILKAWINAFSEWRAQLFTWMSTNDRGEINQPWRLLTQKALRCLEGLLPNDIIRQIEHSGRPIFNQYDVIPEAILDLAVDLAVEQLIQTLFSKDDYACNIRHVRLSTRNFVEKRSVVNKIAAALEDKHNLFGLDKDFLKAMWIDASKYQSDAEDRIQEEINVMLAGVATKEDDILYTRHVEEEMTNKRYLVIVVDGDSDKKLDPRKVHFPAGIVVLITTEPSAQMQEGDEFTCTMDLNIRTLDHLLPWKIFCSFAGSIIVYSPMVIQKIAVQIVEQCRGHLLAIVLVARSLRGMEDVKQWELALDKLSYTNPSYDYQESDRICISRVMVNAFVNIIWEGIKDTQKLCLELSLFVRNIKKGVPKGILICNMVGTEFSRTHEAAQHLFTSPPLGIKVEYPREVAQLETRELQDHFVLLQYESGHVRLPIETYDIIKSLHTLNPSIIKDGALGLTEPPHMGRWYGLIQIELMDNKICELPQSPDCPKLKVLLLQGNADLIDIPESFFAHMPLLEYLDLSYTSIRNLPPSIFKLIHLKKFYLRGCDLFLDLPPEIGQLNNLEDLDLNGTWTTHLPKEIRGLIKLRRLTLCFEGYHEGLGLGKVGKQNSNSIIIPSGVISNLGQLNHLNINVDPEDERWNKNIFDILSEILGLKNLWSVSIYVPKAEVLEMIPPDRLFKFRLVVGHQMRRFISRVTLEVEVEENFKYCSPSIKFVNGVNVPTAVKMNLWRFGALYLDRHMTIKSLSEFQLENLNRLQVCILAECNEMETVFDGSYSNELRDLSLLRIFYMKNLRSIYKGTAPEFHCLKSIALHTCPMLTTIFTLSSLPNLSLLEELIIEDCPKVTTLISHDSSEHDTRIFLPNLRKILLLWLPELVSIFNGLHVKHGLEKMGFYYCPKLRSFSKSELSSESLRVVKGESKWWEAIKWNEAEWGCASQPNFLNLIFSPINEEIDIMKQLAAHDTADQLSLADIDIIKVVGEGNGGVVQLVQHKQTSQFFALKVIEMNAEECMLKQVAQELKINQSAQCPYLVVCYQLFCDNGAISIILEYMDGGSLADLLKQVKIISEPYLAAICKQVLKGLTYLHHERHIIHRDLKPSNLLINHRGEVKITDYGMGASVRANTFTGRYNYMSPERINRSRDGYSYKSDIWSLGLTLLECAMGRFPYPPPDQSKSWGRNFGLIETIIDKPPPSASSEQFSTEFCSFISACLQKDPRDRLSAQELMTHPFIQRYEDLDVDLSVYFSNVRSPLATL